MEEIKFDLIGRVCEKQNFDELLLQIKCGDCQRAMSKKIPGKYKGQPRSYYHYMCSAYMRSGGEICTKHRMTIPKNTEGK